DGKRFLLRSEPERSAEHAATEHTGEVRRQQVDSLSHSALRCCLQPHSGRRLRQLLRFRAARPLHSQPEPRKLHWNLRCSVPGLDRRLCAKRIAAGWRYESAELSGSAGSLRQRFGIQYPAAALGFPAGGLGPDNRFGAYFGDSWRVKSNLTISIGLRYSRDT